MELFYLLCSNLSTLLTSLTLSRNFSFLRPVHHSFCYAVRYALIHLDHTWQPLPNHLSAEEIMRGENPPPLTIPRSVGYEQNPLSLYYWMIVTFVFNPNSDLVAKPLHVSPFMVSNAPADDLFVSISVQHPNLGNYFTATLKAKRVSSSLASDHALFFWWMPHKVAVWIYWHKFWYVIKNFNAVRLLDLDKPHLQPKGSRQGCIANGKSEARFCTWRDASGLSLDSQSVAKKFGASVSAYAST
ncbi:hypothetical protein D8674_002466 [Pyrus ussuriensis x Pyrus communis]|uniref:Uncharacterized protein n=1 Tax=Pyrus ussuriensis x Pyrus communis TaxID=2448454 RepID=A0A5N5FIC6_9ROSA|nr:hypothetical protein D8674_002466 [Pyrus ussuriensis x Pyrus communis]